MKNLENQLRDEMQKIEPSHNIPIPVKDVLVGSLHGQMRKFTVIAWLSMGVFLVLAVTFGLGMLVAEETATRILCGIALHGCIVMICVVKLWYWMLTNRNAVNRELKRLELQVAELCELMKK
ncbi:MAG: hypothetical protein FWH27_06525 [Planctomycetaceae bacterium]|nr:hypothetical protein [Planctomycetaceae bacterium]